MAKLGLDKVNANAAATTASAHAFIANSVKEAKTLGLQFTEEEARQYLDREREAHASGELSNSQLEAVAGGKGEGIPVIGPIVAPVITPIDNNVIQPIGNFFNGNYNKQIERGLADIFRGW